MQPRQVVVIAGVGLVLICLAVTSPVNYPLDGNSMLAVAESIVTRGNFNVPPRLGIVGRDGLYYSRWYPLWSVVAVPFVAMATWTAPFLGLPAHYLAGASMLVLASLVIALDAYLTGLVALRLGASPTGAVIASVAFLFGTCAFVYGRELFAEPLLVLLTIGAIYFELDENGSGIPTGTLTALAVLAKPTGIILGPCLSLHGLAKKRPFIVACAPMLGTCCGLALYMLYNYVRFENPLKFGQFYAFFLDGAPVAMAGLLISPGRGLLWYCPAVAAVALVPLRFFRRLDAILILGVAACYLVLYSAWSYWTGGWCWGPRFLLPALPGLMAMTGLLDDTRRRLLIVLTIAGFAVNAPNLVSYYQRYYAEAKAAGISESARIWVLRDAPIVRIWPTMVHQFAAAEEPASDVKHLVRIADPNAKHDLSHAPTLRIIPLWWWMLPAAGIPQVVGALIMMVMIAAGGALIGLALAKAGP